MRWLAAVLALPGLALLALNLYGFTQDLRPDGLTPEVLRFGDQDLSLTPPELEQAIFRLSDETDRQYAKRLTLDLAAGIAHVEWEAFDPDLFHQRVPVWENYILHLMGVVTSIPEYQRYHYANPYRSIERGIGICGDASMTLSGLLDEQGIANKIITVPGHVMVEAYFDGEPLLLDADFGVVLEQGIMFYEQNPQALISAYQQQLGRVNDGELMIAGNLIKDGFKYWNGTSHFITKKYYFEKVAYVVKWAFPVILLLIAMIIWRKTGRR
ncbi:hypothetical protein ACFSDC_21905 [Alteromonas oceani]